MIRVYQTIFDNKKGNCQAAVWASLLHLDINDVPNFVEQDDDHGAVCDFIKDFGYEYENYIVNPNRIDLTQESIQGYEYLRKELPPFGHINGYYCASVYSPGYWNQQRYERDLAYEPVCHAVIVDKHLNVVHDPNPKYKNTRYPLAESIGFNGVIGVCLYTKIKTEEYVTN